MGCAVPRYGGRCTPSVFSSRFTVVRCSSVFTGQVDNKLAALVVVNVWAARGFRPLLLATAAPTYPKRVAVSEAVALSCAHTRASIIKPGNHRPNCTMACCQIRFGKPKVGVHRALRSRPAETVPCFTVWRNVFDIVCGRPSLFLACSKPL